MIGGHAVRCLCPYRPTRDVDFGVEEVESIDALVEELRQTGDLEILERSPDTVHLRWNAIDVSVFHGSGPQRIGSACQTPVGAFVPERQSRS